MATNDQQPTTEDLHERQAKAVTRAIASLAVRFEPAGFTSEAIAEGAIKGAAVVLLATGSDAADIANLLRDMAEGFDELDKPALRIVQ